MRGVTRVDAAFLATTAGVWSLLALLTGEPWIDRFFAAVMATFLLALLRLAVLAWLSARRAGRRADEVRRIYPDDAARRAVEEERSRLSSEIVRSLHQMLVQVSSEVGRVAGADDPLPGLQRIQGLARRATSDLRRQLGLLRETEEEAAPATPEEPVSGSGVPSRRDLVVAGVVSLLAAVEVTAYLLTEGFGEGYAEGFAGGAAVPVSVALSVTAAASVALRRSAPVVGALWCAAAFVLGAVLGAPVGGGFWAVATVGALVWSLATSAAGGAAVLAWVVLTGSVLYSRVADDRDNAFIFGLIVGVVTVVGLGVRLNRWHGQRSLGRAREHEESLRAAAHLAVRRERQQFAREIHDVVSHAVGLVAMQAAAAEVSWPGDPAAVRRALDVIGSTAESTLAEMDRLLPGTADLAPSPCLQDLVTRIRACGTPVRLEESGEVGPALAPLVYRIVQEGLTNAVRHSPGATVTVRVTARPDALTVVVEDDGTGPDDGHRPGYGLVGIGERVGLLGGTVTAGAGPGGRGFRLRAVVPGVEAEVAR